VDGAQASKGGKPMKMTKLNIKKLNIPLIIGLTIIAALIIFSIYPEVFTPSDPYGEERQDLVFIDGEINLFKPPVEPCAEYPWGTDVYGRDMRSLIFYGCRLTLLTAIFIAFGRLVISLPLAILAGYKNKLAMWVMRQFSIMFSAFPLIIITLLFTRIKLVEDIFRDPTSIVAYILIFFGWSRLANLLKEKVEGILSQDFIEGEIAIGKNRLEIALQNIIPHLIPTIVVLFFLEIAQALLILSQIGVFGLIVSGGIVNGDGDYRMPFEIDWASLLMASQWFMSTGKYWLVFYPAAAFSVSIIGFNLLGEGLRLEFDKRSSRIISWIRGIPGFLSPARLMYEVRHIGTYRRSVRRKLVFYAVILVIVFFPQGGSLYKFDTVNAFSTISELSKSEYEGRKAGSGKNEIIADYIAGKLKAYGVQPFDGDYFHEFEMEMAFNVKNSTMTVVGEASGSAELEFRKDYFITTPSNINGTYELKYVTPKDVGTFPFEEHEFDYFHDKIVLVDVRGLDGLAFARFVGLINNIVRPKALIYISDWESEKVIKKKTVDRKVSNDRATLNISVSSNKGDELLRKANSKITLNIKCEPFDSPMSTSVVGYIPGSDKSLKDEIIFVGSSIDSVGDDEFIKYPSSMEAGGAALELEIARVLGNSRKRPKRTVIFAFWDGTQTVDRGSKYFLEKYFNEEYRKAFYIDLKNFGLKESDKLIIDTTNTLPKEYLAQKYIKVLKKYARRNEVKVVYGKIGSTITQDTLKSDINSIIIDSEGIEDDIKTANDILDNIDRGRLKGPGQMIVDTVYDIVCGGIR
jgi:peptide/nickel transport system permease protein